MHKKVIQGREYFYTSYRDKEGRVKTKYLGTEEVEAQKLEKEFLAPKKNNYVLIVTLLVCALIGLALLKTFTGFFFYQDTGVVEFEWNESWDVSKGFVRVSQNVSVWDSPVSEILNDSKVLVFLGNYNLTNGDVYVDLVYNESVVDSVHVQYLLQNEEVVENVTEELNVSIVNETVEEVLELNESQPEEEIIDEVVSVQNNANIDWSEEVSGLYNAVVEEEDNGLNGTVEFFGLDSLDNVYEVSVIEPSNEDDFGTPIVFVNASNFTSARVNLEIFSDVNRLKKCDDWNGESCGSSWYIVFPDMIDKVGNYLTFNVTSFSAYAGWYNPLSSETDTLEIDYVAIDKLKPLNNETLICENGSVSSDVYDYKYFWYINGNYLDDLNTSSIDSNNISVGDYVDCAMLPYNNSEIIGYWGFEEGSGNYIEEKIWNNSLFVNGNTFWDNRSGRNAFYFDDTTMLTNSTGVKEITYTEQISIEGWIKPLALGQQGLIFEHSPGNRVYFANGKIIFRLNVGSFVDVVSTTAIPMAEENMWQHFVVTYNSTDAMAFLNGVLVNQTSGYSAEIIPLSGSIFMGFSPSYMLKYEGSIDDIIMYNRSLTEAEVLAHYGQGIIKRTEDYMYVETNQEHFGNGSVSRTNVTSQLGNVTLLLNGATYYQRGNFTSKVLEVLNEPNSTLLSWSENKSSGHNVTFQVRTGDWGINGSKIWSEFSGEDYSRANDATIRTAFDFSEEFGNVTMDVSGKSYDGILYNVSFVEEGKHGSALYGDGTGYVSVVSSLHVALDRNFSIEFWIKQDELNNEYVFKKKNSYLFTVDGNDNFVFVPVFDGSISLISHSARNYEGNWTHVGIVYDNQTLDLYLNGVQMNSTAASGTPDLTAFPLDFFRNTESEELYFNGYLDSFVMYNRSLSAAEILDHAQDKYTNSSGQNLPELNRFIQYKMMLETNDTSSTPVVESVSFSFNNYSAFVYNSPPPKLNLDYPTNKSIVNSTTYFNWTNLSDLENDTLYYEYVFSTDRNFSSLTHSGLLINNFSQPNKNDDNWTVIFDDFDSKKYSTDIGWIYRNHKYDTGWNGTGIMFDGIGSANGINTATSSDWTNVGTVEFWFKPNWDATNYDSAMLFSAGEEFNLGKINNDLLTFTLGDDSMVYNISTWSAGVWHHVAVTWEQNKNMSIIVDGEQKNVSNMTSFSIGNIFYLGATTNSAMVANGTFDNFRLTKAVRRPYSEATNNSVTIDPTLNSDAFYYWKVRAVNVDSTGLEGQEIYSNWSNVQQVDFETSAPALSVIQPFVYAYDNISKSLNVTTSENATCFVRNDTSVYDAFNYSTGLVHGHHLNISVFEEYTYFIICNDSLGNEANDTVSFAVTTNNPGTQNSSKKLYFEAGNATWYRFYLLGSAILDVNVTTSTNLTAQMHLIVFGDGIVENDSEGIPSITPDSRKMLLFDDNLKGNLTQVNITVPHSLDLTKPDNGLYYYNVTNNNWTWMSNAVENTYTYLTPVYIDRTFVPGGGELLTSSSGSGSSGDATGLPAEDLVEEDEEEWYECDLNDDCGEGYQCQGGNCVWIGYDECTTDEDCVELYGEGMECYEGYCYVKEELENVIEEEEDSEIEGSELKQAIFGAAEEILGETGTSILVTGAYVGVLGGGAYYGIMMLLAGLFLFKKKYDISEEELEIEMKKE